MRARDFLNIYLPNINSETNFGHIVRIMTTKISELTDKEKSIRKEREKLLNKKCKVVKSANDFNLFARSSFKRKEGDK